MSIKFVDQYSGGNIGRKIQVKSDRSDSYISIFQSKRATKFHCHAARFIFTNIQVEIKEFFFPRKVENI